MLLVCLNCFSQDVEMRLKILSPETSVLQVESVFLNGNKQRVFSFTENLADAQRLNERIESLVFFDLQKQEIFNQKLPNSAFLAEGDPASFSYRINLKAPENVFSAAHVSWVTEKYGLIQLKDILPEFTDTKSIKIRFDLPRDWKISTNEKQIDDKIFLVENPAAAVFLVGSDFREEKLTAGDTSINFAVVGRWQFSDVEAKKSIAEILQSYQKIFDKTPAKQINIFLLPFPKETGFERWRAETRGSNLTILSAPTTFDSAAIQRLNEQLRHELFHLWMPNGLNLSGNYSWFYEGFAQYGALKSGVELNQIRFDDFLNTLNQAFELTNRRSQPIALLDAAIFRWNGENSSVYAKGLIVAFLCDAALLRSSGKDLNNIFREIYEKHNSSNQMQDGSEAILKVLESYAELTPIVEKHVKNANNLIWEKDFAGLGIEKDSAGIKVKPKPNGREKDLLNKLGYNNWRKLLRKQK